MYVFDHISLITYNEKRLQQKLQKKKNTFLRAIIPPPPPENSTVYEIMWKNIVQPGRPQMATWRLRLDT